MRVGVRRGWGDRVVVVEEEEEEKRTRKRGAKWGECNRMSRAPTRDTNSLTHSVCLGDTHSLTRSLSRSLAR